MPPDNGQFLAAAYVVAGVIYLGYTASLMLRARKEVRREK
jgi:threonine/homoserine/homoserine lactone efflux protein